MKAVTPHYYSLGDIAAVFVWPSGGFWEATMGRCPCQAVVGAESAKSKRRSAKHWLLPKPESVI